MDATPRRWTAIVLAGQRPGVDALAAAHGETYKARIAIGGVPMLARVVSTLHAHPAIARTIVLAQDAAATLSSALPPGSRVDWAEAERSIALSILAVIQHGGAAFPILVTTADHPLLDAAILDEFLARAPGHDLAIGVVERQTIEAAYPGNRRTYLRFSDGAFSGANLFALSDARALAALRFWAAAEQDRKRPWRLFRHAGPWLMVRAITRTIRFDSVLRQLAQRLGLSAAPVILSQAEAAIDVDKASDYDLAATILARRGA